VETAIFLGNLRTPEEDGVMRLEIEYSDEVNFDADRSKRLAALFGPAPANELIFHSKANKFLSAILATRPFPIDLELENSIDDDTFVEHLVTRTTCFGSLSLNSFEIDHGRLTRYLINRLSLFMCLKIFDLPHDLLLNFVSAPMQYIHWVLWEHAGSISLAKNRPYIVPKIIDLYSDYYFYQEPFMLQAFDLVAQSDHLEKLTLSMVHYGLEVYARGEEALIHVVREMNNLKYLTFLACEGQWGSRLQELLQALESHKGLKEFAIREYPQRFDHEFKWLKELLTRNRYLRVTTESGWRDYETKEIKDIRRLNRFFRGSKRLQNVPAVDRPPLVFAALTRAFCDFQHAVWLLSDHVDLFCEILHENLPSSLTWRMKAAFRFQRLGKLSCKTAR
jgi:hypothetical protein